MISQKGRKTSVFRIIGQPADKQTECAPDTPGQAENQYNSPMLNFTIEDAQMAHKKTTPTVRVTSRRNFLTSTSMAALSLPTMAGAAAKPDCVNKEDRAKLIAAAPKAPFDSIRDYMAALDAYGLVMHVPEIDQDEYQMTALMFRATDQYGFFSFAGIFI
jgi:hypothetical protein